MQKLDILGISLTDFSLKEALSKMETFVNSGALNTVLFLTTPLLILAGKSEEEQAKVEAMDLTVWGDADILHVAKLESRSRRYEIENQIFLKEILRRTVQQRKTIYILSEDKEDGLLLEEELRAIQSGIRIAGSMVILEDEDKTEDVANAINDVVPTFIISRMALGRQEKWMLDAKPLINAEVWLGIPPDMKLGLKKESIQIRAMKRIYKKIFNSKMNRYNSEKED